MRDVVVLEVEMSQVGTQSQTFNSTDGIVVEIQH